jgi:hypothetical protein
VNYFVLLFDVPQTHERTQHSSGEHSAYVKVAQRERYRAHEKTTTTKCKRTYACNAVISEPKGLGGSNIRSVSQGTVRTFSTRAEGSLCGT